MKTERITIEGLPALVWGEKSDGVFLAVHGNQSSKEDTVIALLAQEAERHGLQTLSFDLPRHGERKNGKTPCKVQFCVRDIETVWRYMLPRWRQKSLFACSMGAYFSMLALQSVSLAQALFLSPVVDMGRVIDNLMAGSGVTEERLRREGEIPTPFGETLFWDYLCYVREHPVSRWDCPTAILRGGMDMLSQRDTIDSFVTRFGARCTEYAPGEHFFHTPEQLEVYKDWLRGEMK